MDKIQLIVTVITIAFCHRRIHSLQSAFHDIMHLLDLNLIFPKGIRMLLCETADKILLLLRKCIQDPCGRFIYSCHDFLWIKFFLCPIFFDHINHTIFLLFHLVKKCTIYSCASLRYFPISGVAKLSITQYRVKRKGEFKKLFPPCFLPVKLLEINTFIRIPFPV